MHYLFLTRKDIKHPRKGGAEVVVENYAKELVKLGHKVTWVGSGFPGGAAEELYEGITIMRIFSIQSIYFLAWYWYLFQYKDKSSVDMVIDEAGGIPLLSPLYIRNKPILFFLHHIGDKEWKHEMNPIIGAIFKLMFSLLLYFYRFFADATMTISRSTQQELIEQYGYNPEKVVVIEDTVDITPLPHIHIKNKKKQLCYVGRISPCKQVEDAVTLFTKFHYKNPEYSLIIAGRCGDKNYEKKLMHAIQTSPARDAISYTGPVSSQERNKIFEESYFTLVPSMKEGYGLVALESNAMGTPVIAYHVSGLKDSVIAGVNGFTIEPKDYKRGLDIFERFNILGYKYHDLCKSCIDHINHLPTRRDNTFVLQELCYQMSQSDPVLLPLYGEETALSFA